MAFLEKAMATHSSVLAWRIQGWGSLVGCRLWGRTESDMTEAIQQQQQQSYQIYKNILTYFIKYINDRAYLYILLLMSRKYVITMVSFVYAKNKLQNLLVVYSKLMFLLLDTTLAIFYTYNEFYVNKDHCDKL